MTTDIDQLAGTVREALTFRSSDPDDTHDALAALDTLVSRFKEAEAQRDAARRRVAGLLSHAALSTPPNQETTTAMDAIGWLGSSGSEVIDMRSTPPNQEDDERNVYHPDTVAAFERNVQPYSPNQEPRRPPLFPGDRAMLRKLPAPPNQEDE